MESVEHPDVVVLPGVPDTGVVRLEDGLWAYPGTTTDVVKLLREQGLTVEWSHPKEERTTVEHKAADIWFPVLEFGRDAAASGVGEAVAAMILGLLRSRKPADTNLHLEFKIRTKGGTREFKSSGPGDEVLKAVEEFGKQT